MTQSLYSYLKDIQKLYATGNSSEHSFRSHIEQLFENLFDKKQQDEYHIINEPKQKNRLRPDLIVTHQDIPVGYIECKDIKDKILDDSLTKAQIKKYFDGGLGDNFILTNYIEFRFYKENELVQSFQLADINNQYSLLENHKDYFEHIENDNIWRIHRSECEKCENALRGFLFDRAGVIRSSVDLSQKMAAKARTMRDTILYALVEDKETHDGELNAQYHSFKKVLIHDMSPEAFADVYAQTVTYGLFAARLHDDTLDDFSLSEAQKLLPLSNPFLKKLFRHLADDTDPRIAWIISDLIGFFRASDVKMMLARYGKSTRQNDPMIHFYEDFLRDYDSTTRKARGVWYTPESVVDFIVRGVDDILKTDFELSDGLADYSKIDVPVEIQGIKTTKNMHRVQVLDPATGTGTFLAHTVKHILEQMTDGSKNTYITQHLIPRLHGFEILMASYAMAHLKLDMLFNDFGYVPAQKNPPRLNIYLTNALEEAHKEKETLFAQYIADEANAASDIKHYYPIMVMIGNPPYSGESQNKNEFIKNLMQDYKYEPTTREKLKERNPKWINDDYVKFMRLAQKFIEKNKQGVIGFITAHGYLDNPTFRGMRYHLLTAFNKIYVLDLHGNAKKKETCPDGSKDDNVFDIQQGVSIIFAVKNISNNKKLAEVYHADLQGKRKIKDEFLFHNSIKTIKWTKIKYGHPMYFFVPKDMKNKKSYDKGFLISDLFILKNVGIVTSRDHFVIDDNKERLIAKLSDFMTSHISDSSLQTKYNLKENQWWKIAKARKHKFNPLHIYPMTYRPFDIRYVYYHTDMITRTRQDVMQHFLKGKNFGLVISRSVVGSYDWADIQIVNHITEFGIMATRVGNGAPVCPLYLYPENTENTPEFTFNAQLKPRRTPNLDDKIIEKLAKTLKLTYVPDHEDDVYHGEYNKKTFNPLDVLDYIYAVLHNPSYREAYKEFLKIEFPRIVYPSDGKRFWQMVALGRQIREIHLLTSPLVTQNLSSYPQDGSNQVEKPRFDTNKIFINDTQYFSDVPQIVWDFYIGGYQPAQKWLKDRKGKELSFEDIIHYKKIIRALAETHRLMEEIKSLETFYEEE